MEKWLAAQIIRQKIVNSGTHMLGALYADSQASTLHAHVDDCASSLPQGNQTL
jgi:hypothetical protein